MSEREGPRDISREHLWIEFVVLCKAVPDAMRQILATIMGEHDDKPAELKQCYEQAEAYWTRAMLVYDGMTIIVEFMQEHGKSDAEVHVGQEKAVLWRVQPTI